MEVAQLLHSAAGSSPCWSSSSYRLPTYYDAAPQQHKTTLLPRPPPSWWARTKNNDNRTNE